MLQPRIIPCLLIHNGGLVKTRQFSEPKYVGDPVNAVRIFNEKEVDELLVLDIDSSAMSQEPNYDLISQLAAECRMPLTYGGGINSTDQVEQIINLGVEKVAMSSAAISNQRLIESAARKVGSQSIVVIGDTRLDNYGNYRVFINNGNVDTGMEIEDLARLAEKAGAGEFIINNICRDGMCNGYDMDLVSKCRSACSLPISVLGGAGSLQDIAQLIESFPIIGAAAGSLFVFKGKYRAVLINYPERQTKIKLFGRNN